MRILAYGSPERGHLYPIVPTLLALRRRGHHVAVRTLPAEVMRLRALGLDAASVDPRIAAIEPDDWRASNPISALRADVAGFIARAPLEREDLARAIAEVQPDLLYIDTTCWGAAALAEASGKPWAYFAHFVLPLPSIDAPPYGLGLAPRLDAWGRLRDALATRLVLRPLERIVTRPLNRLRRELGLPPVEDASALFLRAPLVVAYTAEPFEYPRRDWPKQVRLVGPGAWDPPEPDPEWLQGCADPLVLVTCSSQFQNDGVLATTASQAIAGTHLSAVITTAGVDPASVPSAENVRVVRYAPHAAILRRAACVVCHGGMGITQKALSAGVPLCVVPFGRDQFEVARRVEVAGAGVVLSRGKLTPARLRDAIERACARRENAQRIAEAFQRAGGAEQAGSALEALVSPILRTGAEHVHA